MTVMKNNDSAFERFGAYVCGKRDWSDPSESFEKFCRESGADPVRLDCRLVDELGMTGGEILQALRMENEAGSEIWIYMG